MNDVNKMQMFQMSINTKYFLFHNRIMARIFVYELLMEQRNNEKKFGFVLRYELQISKSFLFQHMLSISINPMEFFYANRSYIKIDDSGQVTMCYVQNLPFVEDGGGSDED